jgi:type II secretory pathway pseudopilin PulG
METLVSHVMETVVSNRNPRREGGIALLIAILMLIIFGAMAVASMDTVTRDRQIAGIHSQAHLAFQAAEAGVSAGLAALRNPAVQWPTSIGGLATFSPPLPNVALGDAYDHPYGQPNYVPDPDAPAAIQYLGVGGECPEWDVSVEVSNIGGGGLTVLETLFDVRVQGQVPTGARARIEAGAARCHVFEQG